MHVTTNRKRVWLFLGLLLPALAGCGSATVTGTVTYKGRLITQGKITFVAAEENGAAAGTDIENGKYTIKDISPGNKKVYILAEGMQPGAPAETGKELSLPAEAPKDLTVEVTRGRQEHDFPLKELTTVAPTKE